MTAALRAQTRFAFLTELSGRLAPIFGASSIEVQSDEDMGDEGLFISYPTAGLVMSVEFNAVSGDVEVHARRLGRGPVVSISSRLPRAQQLRLLVDAVEAVAASID